MLGPKVKRVTSNLSFNSKEKKNPREFIVAKKFAIHDDTPKNHAVGT